MAKRSTAPQCPIDYALQVFGDRWSLIVLRDLLLAGKTQYKELLGCREGIATNILAARLKKLEAFGLVERRTGEEDARTVHYVVTDKAIDLIPILLELSRWSANHTQTIVTARQRRRLTRDRDGYVSELTELARARRAGL